MPHPAYSPDLAPSDYYLFLILKQELKGRRFESIDEVKSITVQWLDSQSKSFYRDGLLKLKDRWLKCFNTDGDYVEKL